MNNNNEVTCFTACPHRQALNREGTQFTTSLPRIKKGLLSGANISKNTKKHRIILGKSTKSTNTNMGFVYVARPSVQLPPIADTQEFGGPNAITPRTLCPKTILRSICIYLVPSLLVLGVVNYSGFICSSFCLYCVDFYIPSFIHVVVTYYNFLSWQFFSSPTVPGFWAPLGPVCAMGAQYTSCTHSDVT